MHLKKCDYCQEEFQAVRMSANYCSPSCKQLAYVQRLENKIEGEEEENEDEDEDEENYEDLGDENEEFEEEEDENEPPHEEELNDVPDKIENSKKQKESEQQPKEQKHIPLSHEEYLWADDEVEYRPKQKSNSKKEVKAEISDKESRQVSATRIFINYLSHLKSIYGQSIKRERFDDVLICFQTLRNDYIKRNSKDYSVYPFAEDLENIIIEMETYIVKYVKGKDKRICFDLGEEYLVELEEVAEELEQYKDSILERYR